jgi:hypothetical protein
MSRRALHHGVVWAGWYGVGPIVTRAVVSVKYMVSITVPWGWKALFGSIFLCIYDLIRRYPDRS